MASVTTDKRTGNFVVRAYGGVNPDTGRPYQPSEVVPKDAGEEALQAAIARVEAIASVAKGDTRGMTVGTLVNYYLEGCELSGMSPTTISAYRSYNRKHVQPRIGGVPLAKASAATFSGLYRQLLRGADAGGAGLSVATVEKVHAFLSGCFTRLSADGVAPKNPMRGAKPPRGRTKEAHALVPADFAALREYLFAALHAPFSDAEGFEAYMQAVCWWVDMHTGIRRGELAGAQRLHVQRYGDETGLRILRVRAHKDGVGWIYKQPKSESSKRFVTLDGETDALLREYMAVQAAVLAEGGVRATRETPLFAHADGSQFEPGEITDAFGELARRLDLEKGTHLHTLRHTHATYLLESGENIRAVQERLGHARINTTLELYGHVLPGRDGEVARSFAQMAKDMQGARHEAAAPLYVPKCPLSGETCARFKELEDYANDGAKN